MRRPTRPSLRAIAHATITILLLACLVLPWWVVLTESNGATHRAAARPFSPGPFQDAEGYPGLDAEARLTGILVLAAAATGLASTIIACRRDADETGPTRRRILLAFATATLTSTAILYAATAWPEEANDGRYAFFDDEHESGDAGPFVTDSRVRTHAGTGWWTAVVASIASLSLAADDTRRSRSPRVGDTP